MGISAVGWSTPVWADSPPHARPPEHPTGEQSEPSRDGVLDNKGVYLMLSLPTPGAWGLGGGSSEGWTAETESIFQTGVAAGYAGGKPDGFKWASGLAFRYTALPQYDLMAELRLGGGTPRVFGYGVLGVGVASLVGEVGLTQRAGAGAQFMVWRGVTLGFELDFETVWAQGLDTGVSVWTFTPAMLLGWTFGRPLP